MPPEQIVVELTESAISGDLEFVVSTLKELKAMGLTIAIDDFGTGHSSLSHLVALPVDVLKIDRTFVAGLPADEGKAAIVDAVVTLARRLHLGVVAEGIENCRAAALPAPAGLRCRSGLPVQPRGQRRRIRTAGRGINRSRPRRLDPRRLNRGRLQLRQPILDAQRCDLTLEPFDDFRVVGDATLAADRLLLVLREAGVVDTLGARRRLRVPQAAQVGVMSSLN